MKEIIGCEELTHDVLKNYLNTFWWKRKMLPWEDCGKSFQKVYSPMKRKLLNNGIYLCNYYDKLYYFGLGLDEPFVTNDMIKNGVWFVYTWSS